MPFMNSQSYPSATGVSNQWLSALPGGVTAVSSHSTSCGVGCVSFIRGTRILSYQHKRIKQQLSPETATPSVPLTMPRAPASHNKLSDQHFDRFVDMLTVNKYGSSLRYGLNCMISRQRSSAAGAGCWGVGHGPPHHQINGMAWRDLILSPFPFLFTLRFPVRVPQVCMPFVALSTGSRLNIAAFVGVRLFQSLSLGVTCRLCHEVRHGQTVFILPNFPGIRSGIGHRRGGSQICNRLT